MNRSGVTNLEVCTSTMLMKVNKQEKGMIESLNRPVLRRSSLDEMPQFFNVLLET
jgi:lipopolysaccharide/colanic/teichoic acid biosynthesis glycosyltransferase